MLKPTGCSDSSAEHRRQVCFAPFPLFAIANVDDWIDFLVPPRRSLGGLGEVTRMDDEQDGPGLGRYRHHICYQVTTCNSNTLNSTSSCCLSPFTERRGAVDAKSQCLVPGLAQQPSPTGRCTFERPKDQGVEMIMLNSCALNTPWDVKELWGCGKRACGRSAG